MTVLDKVKSSAELQKLLFELCDFELSEADAPSWIKFESGSDAAPFGRDGAGGLFFTLHRHGRTEASVIYVSSEGHAGCLATSMDAFFATISAIPHWKDCLHFSSGGSLAEMRRCDPLLAAEHRSDIEGYERKRKRLLKLIGVSASPDAMLALHEAVESASPPMVCAAEDGTSFGGLFNTFTLRG